MTDAAIWPSAVLQPVDEDHSQFIDRVMVEIESSRRTTRGIAKQSRDNERDAARWLLEGLLQAATSFPPVKLVLPRSEINYGTSPDKIIKLSYSATTRVLEALTGLGWLGRRKGYKSTDSGEYSRYWAKGEFLAYCKNRGQVWREMTSPPPEGLILIADKPNKTPPTAVDDSEGADVAHWRYNLDRINTLLRSKCIMLDATNELIGEIATAAINKQIASASKGKRYVVPLQFGNVTLRRIFARGRLDYGGRFYGGWWMNIPSRYRRNIMIDDELTVEYDFSGMALRCLYAQEGLDIGPADPYDIGLPNYSGRVDPRRAIVKEYVNAALNDVDNKYRLSSVKLKLLGVTFSKLRKLVAQRHYQVAHHFHSGIGLHLQFIDSQIAEAVMLRFAEKNEAVLPIHDSFIVRAGLESQLATVMEEEFNRITGKPSVITPETSPRDDRSWTGPPKNIAEIGSIIERLSETLSDHFSDCSIAQGYSASWIAATWDEDRHRGEDALLDQWKDRQDWYKSS
jgi:hypothetical protein